jgi:hypothetical protein
VGFLVSIPQICTGNFLKTFGIMKKNPTKGEPIRPWIQVYKTIYDDIKNHSKINQDIVACFATENFSLIDPSSRKVLFLLKYRKQ